MCCDAMRGGEWRLKEEGGKTATGSSLQQHRREQRQRNDQQHAQPTTRQQAGRRASAGAGGAHEQRQQRQRRRRRRKAPRTAGWNWRLAACTAPSRGGWCATRQRCSATACTIVVQSSALPRMGCCRVESSLPSSPPGTPLDQPMRRDAPSFSSLHHRARSNRGGRRSSDSDAIDSGADSSRPFDD